MKNGVNSNPHYHWWNSLTCRLKPIIEVSGFMSRVFLFCYVIVFLSPVSCCLSHAVGLSHSISMFAGCSFEFTPGSFIMVNPNQLEYHRSCWVNHHFATKISFFAGGVTIVEGYILICVVQYGKIPVLPPINHHVFQFWWSKSYKNPYMIGKSHSKSCVPCFCWSKSLGISLHVPFSGT